MTYGLGLLLIGLLAGVAAAAYIIGGARKEKEMVKDYADTAEKVAVKANKAKSSVAKSKSPSTSSVRAKYTRK